MKNIYRITVRFDNSHGDFELFLKTIKDFAHSGSLIEYRNNDANLYVIMSHENVNKKSIKRRIDYASCPDKCSIPGTIPNIREIIVAIRPEMTTDEVLVRNFISNLIDSGVSLEYTCETQFQHAL